VHLFPDLLRFYGDGGNVATLVRRASLRSIEVEVAEVTVGAARLPPADLVFIGGGQDREQVMVAGELERLGPQLTDQVANGAALLAVCGGYQNLGTAYRTAVGEELPCPGLLPVSTDATGRGRRLVGPVVARLRPAALQMAGVAVTMPGAGRGRGARNDAVPTRTLVGFENHGGRTTLALHAAPLADVEIGYGNNGVDGSEGVLRRPGDDGLLGLRVGTYLHGPLLPRNPHLADALIAAASARHGVPRPLAPLDDAVDWDAHLAARARIRRSSRSRRSITDRASALLDPVRGLIGF
jgi:lipid II isoglutaminyl synthase (glutamine-hydrolysing)